MGINVKEIYRTWYRLSVHIRPIMLLLYWNYAPNEFIIFPNKKMSYLPISKVANSSLKKCLLPLQELDSFDIKDNYSIHSLPWVKKFWSPPQDYWTFTFVRNPFDRLVSAYKSKFLKDIQDGWKFQLRYYPFWNLNAWITFDEFVDSIYAIPDYLADTHFKSQYSTVYTKQWTCLVDYIWKYETLDTDFKLIQEKYDLDSLPSFNVTNKSSSDTYLKYYTLESFEKVYQRYKNDVINFWYQDQYLEDLASLSSFV